MTGVLLNKRGILIGGVVKKIELIRLRIAL